MSQLAPKPMAVAIAVAAALWGSSAHALLVDANVSGSLTVNGSVIASQATPGDSSPISGSNNLSGIGGLNSFFYGNLDTGSTNMRAISGLQNQVDSLIIYTAVVTNDSASAQDVAFNFFLGRGRVGVDTNFSSPTQNGFGNASLASSITWGGSTLWSVGVAVDKATGAAATNTVTTTPSAAGFTTSASGDSVYYDAYTGNLGLGTLAAGESKTLSYSILGSAYYDNNGDDVSFYGYGGRAVVGNTDPFDFVGSSPDEPSGFATSFAGTPSQPVPEPGTWALMGAGLAGIWAGSRTRRRRARPA